MQILHGGGEVRPIVVSKIQLANPKSEITKL
jgi:hypothetical protein